MPSEIEGLIFPYFFAKNRIFGCLGANMGLCWRQHGAMLALNLHSEGILC